MTSPTSSRELEESDLDLKEQKASNVYGVVTSTNMQTKSILDNGPMPIIIQATLGESIQKTFPTTISFVLDFLANPSRWLGRGKVSKIPVERYSSRYVELRKLSNLRGYCLRMSPGSSTTMKDLRSKSSWNRWMNWGIGLNGKYLTAHILDHPKGEKEYSLWDILENEVEDQYFLPLTPSRIQMIKDASKEGRLFQRSQQNKIEGRHS